MWLPKAIGPLIHSGILPASVASAALNAVFNAPPATPVACDAAMAAGA